MTLESDEALLARLQVQTPQKALEHQHRMLEAGRDLSDQFVRRLLMIGCATFDSAGSATTTPLSCGSP